MPKKKTTAKSSKKKSQSLEQIKQLLLKRREALRQTLHGQLGTLYQSEGTRGGDVVDAALDSEQNELSSQLAEVEGRELALIEKALRRIESGEYGICETCGQKIPVGRLKILPYATMCVQCQREAELTGEYDAGLPLAGEDFFTTNDLELDLS